MGNEFKKGGKYSTIEIEMNDIFVLLLHLLYLP